MSSPQPANTFCNALAPVNSVGSPLLSQERLSRSVARDISDSVFPLFNRNGGVIGSSHFVRPGLLVTARHIQRDGEAIFFSCRDRPITFRIDNLPHRVFDDVIIFNLQNYTIPSKRHSIGSLTGGETTYLFHAANGNVTLEPPGMAANTPLNAQPLNLLYQSRGGSGASGGVVVNTEGQFLAIHRGVNTSDSDSRTAMLYQDVIEQEKQRYGDSWIETPLRGSQLLQPAGSANPTPALFGEVPEMSDENQLKAWNDTYTNDFVSEFSSIQGLRVVLDKSKDSSAGSVDACLVDTCKHLIDPEFDGTKLLGERFKFDISRIDLQHVNQNGVKNFQPQVGGGGQYIPRNKGKSTSFGMIMLSKIFTHRYENDPRYGDLIKKAHFLSIMKTRFDKSTKTRKNPEGLIWGLSIG